MALNISKFTQISWALPGFSLWLAENVWNHKFSMILVLLYKSTQVYLQMN